MGLVQHARRGGYIELNHLLAVMLSGVGYLYGQADFFPVGRSLKCFHFEIGIAQTVAEGIQGLYTEAVKIAVANIDSLGVHRMQLRIIMVSKVFGSGIVLILCSQGIGQLAAGIDLAQQHLRKGISHLHTPEAHVQHCADAGDLFHEAKIHSAGIQHHHSMGIVGSNSGQIGPFPVGNQPVALFGLPVAAFACIPAQDINSGGRFGCFQIFGGDFRFLCQNGYTAPFPVQHGQGFIFFVHHALMIGATLQPAGACQCESGLFQAFPHRYRMGREYVTTAGTAVYGAAGTCTEKCQLSCFQRQSAVIFQQHHTLRGGSANQRRVFRVRQLAEISGKNAFCLL